jgi:hypothetical protein
MGDTMSQPLSGGDIKNLINNESDNFHMYWKLIEESAHWEHEFDQ